MIAEIILLLVLILLNGFFSLSEMAIVSSRKARLRHKADQGDVRYKLALNASREPGKYLSAIQVVITLIGILTGAVGGLTFSDSLAAWFMTIPFLVPVATPLAVFLVVLLTTLVSVIFGELVPKSLALSNPEKTAAWTIRPLVVVSNLFYPLVKFLTDTTALVVKTLGIAKRQEPEVTEDEVKVLIAQGAETGIFHNSEKEMVDGVFDLDDRRVTVYMVPRTEVQAIDISVTKRILPEDVVNHADLPYLPVVKGDLDDVVGMIDVRTALAAIARDKSANLSQLMEKPLLIPETISALKALSLLQKADVGTGLIVDEYGGISGLVSQGDLLESILGALSENPDELMPGVVKREDGSLLVDGALSIAEFAETLDIDEGSLSQHDYDTVAGLILDCMGSIPKTGDSCEWNGWRIEILDMDGNRIDKVLVQKLPEAAATVPD